jgi:hypothetical protein
MSIKVLEEKKMVQTSNGLYWVKIHPQTKTADECAIFVLVVEPVYGPNAYKKHYVKARDFDHAFHLGMIDLFPDE